MNHESADNHRADLMQPVFERCHDTEVTAATADRPEQIAVLVGARVHQLTSCQHQIGADDVVHGHPESPFEPPEATAECQTGNSGITYSSTRGRETERLRLTIELSPAQAGFGTHGLRLAIHPDALHVREVDHQAVVARPHAGDAMRTATNGYRQGIVTPVIHRRHHIRGAAASDDDRRAPIDHGVPDTTALVVPWIIRCDDRPAMGRLQLFECCVLHGHDSRLHELRST
jgi:hypothetical protein